MEFVVVELHTCWLLIWWFAVSVGEGLFIGVVRLRGWWAEWEERCWWGCEGYGAIALLVEKRSVREM